jgi:basic membrane protein A
LSGFKSFYTEQCQAVLDGTWSAPSEAVLLDSALGSWGAEIPQEVQDAVAEAAAAIASGELNIFEGPHTDNQGNEALAAGVVTDSQGAYAMSYALEGVSGL